MGNFFSTQKASAAQDFILVQNYIIDNRGNRVRHDQLTASRFIGMLDNEESSSMACLLNDGTVLTTLHGIYDFEKKRYADTRDITVTFIYKNQLWIYSIDEVIHDGRTAILSGMNTFDYARLKLKGTPVEDLEGGLTLDSNDHFAGMAGSNDPNTTQSISGPLLQIDNQGKLFSTQITSFSENAAARSQYYFFPQEGNHTGNPGFSGQAILYPNTTILYAIHIGLDKASGKRIGIKISEYLSTVRSLATLSPSSTHFPSTIVSTHIQDIVLQIRREKLRRCGADITDVITFLNQLSDSIAKKKLLAPNCIPVSFQNLVVVDTHQKQHLKGQGGRPEKGYFYEYIATSDTNPTLNALANCINKLVSEHYSRHLKTTDAETNKIIRTTKKFIVDLEFNIGIDIKAGNKETSCILLEGFGGKNYHIYPVVAERLRGSIPVLINARNIIQEAQQNRLKY